MEETKNVHPKKKNSANIFLKKSCMKKKKKKQTGGGASSPPPASPARGASLPCRFTAAPPRRAASQHVWSLGLLPASPSVRRTSTPLRGGSSQQRRIRGQADTGVGEEAL